MAIPPERPKSPRVRRMPCLYCLIAASYDPALKSLFPSSLRVRPWAKATSAGSPAEPGVAELSPAEADAEAASVFFFPLPCVGFGSASGLRAPWGGLTIFTSVVVAVVLEYWE